MKIIKDITVILLISFVFIIVKVKQTAGIKSIIWDGKDCNGKIVDSGMYIYFAKVGENVYSRKMVLL